MEKLNVFNLNDRATGDSITLEWEVETDAPEETLSFEAAIFGKVKVQDEKGVEQEEEKLFVQTAETPRAHTFTNLDGFPLLPETEYCMFVHVYEEPGHVFLGEFPDDGIGHIAKTLNVDKKAPKLKNTKLSVTNQTRDGFTVNWEKANDETTKDNKINYEVYLGKEGAKPRLVYEEKGITSYSFTELESGVTYEVYVKAVDEAGNAVQYTSSKISLGDKTAPYAQRRTLQVLRVTGDGFTVAWMKATDNFTEANKILYRVFVKEVTSSKKTQWQPVKEAEDISSCVLTGLKSGTRYDVYVLAIDEDGNEFRYPGDGDAVATVVTKDTEAPKTDNSLKATADAESVTLTWKPATDNVTATDKIRYTVHLITGNKKKDQYSIIKEIIGETSYTITGLRSGSEYHFMVVAIDEAGNDLAYNTVTVKTLDKEAPKTDNSLKATADANSVTLKWTQATDNVSAPGNIRYKVFQQVAGGQKQVDLVSGTSTTITGLSSGTQYIFRVYAVDEAGNNRPYNTVTVKTLDKEAPKTDDSLKATADANSVTLKWTQATDNVSAPGNIRYKIYRNVSGNWQYVKDVTGTSTSITGLSSGTQYSFKVDAVDEAGNACPYNVVTVKTLDKEAPKTDNSLTATSDVNSVTLKWNPAKDNVTAANKIRYEIFQLVSGTWRIVEVVTGQTSYKVNGLGASTKFSFKVDAIDEADNRLSYNTVTVSTKDGVAPQTSNSLTATADTNSVTLKWAQATDDITAPGNIRYKVYRKVTGGRSLIKTVSATSTTVTGLSSGTQYIFEVDALDEADNACSYNQVTVTTKVAVTGVSLSSSSISLLRGQSKQLTATVSPSNANNKAVSWSTGNSSVATVSNGLVKAVNSGTTTVKVVTSDGAKVASTNVNVTSLALHLCYNNSKGGYSSDITVPSIVRPYADNGRFNVGQKIVVYLYGYFGSEKKHYSLDNSYVECLVSNAAILSIRKSYIGNNCPALCFEFLKNGTSNVTIRVKDPLGSGYLLQQTFTVEVKNPAWEKVAVTGVSLSHSSISLISGQTQQISATVSPSNATNKSVSWSSGNSSIASVSSSGLIKAVTSGNTTVRAVTVDGSKMASVNVKVTRLELHICYNKSGGGYASDLLAPSIVRPFADNGKFNVGNQNKIVVYVYAYCGSELQQSFKLDNSYVECTVSDASVLSVQKSFIGVGSPAIMLHFLKTGYTNAVSFFRKAGGVPIRCNVTIRVKDPKGSGYLMQQTFLVDLSK